MNTSLEELLSLKTTAVFVVFVFQCYTIGCFDICKEDFKAIAPGNLIKKRDEIKKQTNIDEKQMKIDRKEG